MRSLFCFVLAATLYSIMGEATTVFDKVEVTSAQILGTHLVSASSILI